MNSILKRREIQNIIYNVLNNNWNTDYTIRYVTVEVSKLVKKDVEFFKMTDDEKVKHIVSLDYELSYPNVVCKTIHELIKDVLDYLGIESKVVIATNTRVPLFALIVEGEHGRYFIDALNDLFRTQYHIQPVTYGNFIRSKNCVLDSNKLITLDPEYIREMDLDLGIIDKEYFSDSIDRVKTKYTDRNMAKRLFVAENSLDLVKKKMGVISNNYINRYKLEGPLERVGLHVYLRNQLFNKSERKRFWVVLSEDNHVVLINDFAGECISYEEVKENNNYKLIPKEYIKK